MIGPIPKLIVQVGKIGYWQSACRWKCGVLPRTRGIILLGELAWTATTQVAVVANHEPRMLLKTISWIRGLHLSGADDQGPRDAVVVVVDRSKTLWLLRLDGDPGAGYIGRSQRSGLSHSFLTD
jgi:hypothetical protein